jgi:hypothetical protein
LEEFGGDVQAVEISALTVSGFVMVHYVTVGKLGVESVRHYVSHKVNVP